MKRCPDLTLWGYVFTDEDHARKWLSAYGARAAEFQLERVHVGPLQACKSCGGSGFHQSVKKIENVSLAEVLNG